jgi:Tfp pilus assembly protein PilO
MQLKSIVTLISRLSKRERTIFYVTVFVVGVVLLDRLILSPILSKITELNDTIRLEEEAIEQSLLIVTQEKRIEGEAKEYSSYLSKVQTEEKEVTSFLKEVENIAKQSAVYLIDVKPSGKNVDGVSTRYFVKLSFEAQMEQVMNFFHSITNFNQLLKIESFEIAPKSEGGSVVTCSTSISKAIIPE